MRAAPDDTEAQRETFMALVAALEGQEIAIGADVGGMTIDGHAIPQSAPFVAELHGQFTAHGVGLITLPHDLPTASLMILVQTLARPHGEIHSGSEFADLLDVEGKRLIAVRSSRDLPEADQLVTPSSPDKDLSDTSFSSPPAESAVGDSSPPFWQDEGAALDPLREAQVAVDAAARAGRWLQVLDIIGKIVAKQTKSADQLQRRRYRLAIQAMAPRRTVEALAELSLQGHRLTVLAILQQLGAEATAVLLELMASAPTVEARREYFTLLSQMRLGTEAIINRLSDEEWFVLRNVAELCGELGMEDAVPYLANHVDHSDPRVRRAVVGALARIGTNQAAEPLRQALHDPEPTVRIQAAQMLDGGKSRGLAMTLALMLDEEGHPDVRRELHLALGRIGTMEAIQALVRSSKPGRALFGRKPTAIRVAAVQGLALCNRPEAFAALKELASDKTAEVQNAAKEALGAFDTRT
ncbi:MAG: HEAT repeat domain-containing protein [Gemmatimonadales bacterium]